MKDSIIKKVNVNNTKKLTEALDAVQKRCRIHLVQVEDVNKIAQRCEAHLETYRIPKKWRQGARFEYQAAGFKPGRYTTPSVTMIKLEKGIKDWFLIDVRRITRSDHEILKWLNPENYADIITSKAVRV